jgi:hypothetical protein
LGEERVVIVVFSFGDLCLDVDVDGHGSIFQATLGVYGRQTSRGKKDERAL